MPNFDEVAKLIIEKWELLAAIVAIVGAGVISVAGVFYRDWQNRRKAERLRQLPSGDFPFDVIKPRSPDLLKQIMGGDENSPLADYKIPYQERQPDRNVRQELEAAFTEKNWILILGKSGLGKTREAAHLAEVLNQEGWTVLKLADRPGEWLDVPKEFPSEISPNDKLLFFLDDLNRWMYAGNSHEIYPRAGEESARPMREPVQERLPRLLQYFEHQGKSRYVRVIATARNEREPDKLGETSPWDKLQWEKYKPFWQQFHCYLLADLSESGAVSLITDCVAVAGLRGVPEDYWQIARRNDGTFRNLTENLNRAWNRGLAVNNQEFSPNLDETWRTHYNDAVKRYPLAVYAYDAVELLRSLNLGLTAPMLSATTKRLLPGRGVRRWWQTWQLLPVLNYLVITEQILKPKDGQIEAKKTGAVDVGRYVPAILQQLGQMARQDPTYPVAAECLDCGNALYGLSRYEEAIASYDQALKFKPNKHEAWSNRGGALGKLGNDEDAIASFDEALKIKPDYPEAWSNRGVALVNLNRHEDAIASFDEALKIKPDYPEAWSNRGGAMGNLERNEEAITNYNQALKFKPDYYQASYNRGVILNKLDRHEEAITSYDQALKIKLEYYQAWYNRGVTLSNLGRQKEAINSYNCALQLKPDFHDAWYMQGLELVNLRQAEEALTSFDQAVKLKPNFYDAWYYRGVVLCKLVRHEEAISDFDQVLQVKPDFHEAWSNRGVALSALGRKEDAITSFDRALLLSPDNADVYYNKACCYGLQKDVDLAIATLQQAINLNYKYRELAETDPDFDSIRQDDRFRSLLDPNLDS